MKFRVICLNQLVVRPFQNLLPIGRAWCTYDYHHITTLPVCCRLPIRQRTKTKQNKIKYVLVDLLTLRTDLLPLGLLTKL